MDGPDRHGRGADIEREVVGERGMPRDVREEKAAVAREVDAEVRLGDRIAPFDVQFRVEQHDAVRQRACRLLKARERCRKPGAVRLFTPPRPVQRREDAVPGAPSFGNRRLLGRLEPALQPVQVDQLHDDDGKQAQAPEQPSRRLSEGEADRDAGQCERHQLRRRRGPERAPVAHRESSR